MVMRINVEGCDALEKVLDENKDHTIFVLFTGSPDDTGKSWCPDCVKGKLMLTT